jgi:hypothetical protein
MRHSGLNLSTCAILLGMVGCFTETGNPGDNDTAVRAQFYVDYSSEISVLHKNGTPNSAPIQSIHISNFFMTIMDAEFDTDLGDTDFADGKPKRIIDFTKPESLLWVKPEALSGAAWKIFHFNFRIPRAMPMDTRNLDFFAFHDPAYLKGDIATANIQTHFLIELPKLDWFGLYYLDSSLAKMKTTEGWNIPIALHTKRMFHGLRIDTLPITLDRSGIPFVLINHETDTPVWKIARDNFYRSFGVDSIEVNGITLTE